MANMRRSLHGGAAEIDPHFTGLKWKKGRSGSREGVI
jgi:hypothetical protein